MSVRRSTRLRDLYGILLAAGLLLYGLYSFPYALMGPELTQVPGDMGDARFNNYILEHFYLFVTGSTEDYWDAPFMYPHRNVLAHSDNLLGSAPLYALFRSNGFDRIEAYQRWILTLFALNFVCCFLALFLWSRNAFLAALGAFIFAFGIYHLGHTDHMQVFPKFMVPLAFYWTWQWASQKGMRFLYYALGALVLQFYCGMYLGLMLAYTLFFLVLGFGVAHWRLGVFNGVFKGRNVLLSLVGIVIALVLLMPLMLPYIDASRSIDPRTLDDVINTVPSPRSYFFTHIAASSWHSLVYHGRDALADWWYQFNWVGITPWLVMLALPYLLARSTSLDRPVVIGMISGMALSLAFCLNIGGRSLYELFLSLPGFNAMRSLDRFIHVQVMFFILLFVLALKDLRLPRTMQVLAGIAIPALVIVDNKVITAELKSFPAADDRAQVETISLRIQQQYEPQHAAIAYMPVLGLDAMDDPHMHLIELHLSSMLAAQELGIPIVNAYTGNYPGNYMQFFDHLDRPALEAWCEQEKISADQVEVISNVDLPIRSIEEILITTYSGDTVRYIDPQGGALQLGDAIGGKALLAEQIELMDGRSAFMAGNGMFICAELEDEAQFSATAPQLGDFALFHPVSLLDGSTALRTFNGLFIQADPSTGRLFAGELSGDTLGFRMVPVIP